MRTGFTTQSRGPVPYRRSLAGVHRWATHLVSNNNRQRGLSRGLAAHVSKLVRYHNSRVFSMTRDDSGFILLRVEGRVGHCADDLGSDYVAFGVIIDATFETS